VRKITEIIVHCTATRADWWAGKRTSEKVREIKRWHVQDRGWSDIGYHFLIDRDGTVAKGRDIARDGAHVQGKNKGTIGISLFGGHGSAETDKFSQHFTPQQDAALRKLIGDLHGSYGKVPVTGHNQYAAKACPGFNVPAWFGARAIPAKPATAPQKPAQRESAAPAPEATAKPGYGAGVAVGALAAAGGWAAAKWAEVTQAWADFWVWAFSFIN
jgi:N-acetylmuramoyl-L-alanine amidase